MQDDLTELPNRRYAIFELDQLINNRKRYGGTFSVLFINIDKFKAVNDNYGHEYGDLVLKLLAKFFIENLRKSDVACRLGGDEFLIICNNCDAESAMKLGTKLNEMVKSIDLQNIEKYWAPSLSIGVTEIDDSCETSNDILKKADHAMYISKENGGGHTVLSEK